MGNTTLQDMQDAASEQLRHHQAEEEAGREADRAYDQKIHEMLKELAPHLEALRIIQQWVRADLASKVEFSISGIPIGQQLADGESPQYRPVITTDSDTHQSTARLIIFHNDWIMKVDGAAYGDHNLEGLELLGRLDMRFVAQKVVDAACRNGINPPIFSAPPQDAPAPQDAALADVYPMPRRQTNCSHGAF